MKENNIMKLTDDRTVSVKFYLYNLGKVENDIYPIYARIIYRRQKSDISMRLQARREEWDFENEMYYPSTPGNRYKNNRLLTAKDELKNIVSRLRNEKQEFSVQAIRKLFRGIAHEHSQMRFIDYYDSYVDDCRQRPAEYGEGVIEHYQKTRRHMVNYMTSKNILNLSLRNLSRNFVVGFAHHLLSTNIKDKDYAMNRNTATTYLRKLIASVNRAVEKDMLDRNPFVGFKLPKYKVQQVTYISSEDIAKLSKHDLGGNKTLDKARKVFLFSVYTGLRFSDALNLREENIKTDRDGNMFIRLVQKKTKDILEVPLLDQAIKIYDMFKTEREKTGYVLPRACNQNINSYLKVIASMVGIDVKLTHKVGRHTFATTIALENGVDLETVSKLLGHTSIRSTEIYAHVTKRKMVGAVQLLNSKLREQ